jgi:hypothetical protein
MKRYTDYLVEDFASDPLFIKWVKYPDDHEISNFWTLYLYNNPEKSAEVSQARELVGGITQTFTELSTSETRTLWRRVHRTINGTPEGNHATRSFSPLLSAPPISRWFIIVGMMLVGWIIWQMI